jgi:hypothetical protein
MKIVVNRAFGGYSLSKEACNHIGIDYDGYGYDFENDRTNPKLIEAVETLGEKANGSLAALQVIEIPDDVDWYIDEYDGWETIRENHRSW